MSEELLEQEIILLEILDVIDPHEILQIDLELNEENE
jgi:hypothetical protein